MKKIASFTASICFIALFASVLAFASNVPFYLLFGGITAASVFMPAMPGILGTNGIVARENFRLANQVFNNAFNPVQLPAKDPTGRNVLAPNPKYDPTWDAAVAFRLVQSTLRFEQPILQGGAPTGLYTFPVLANISNQGGQAQFNTEVRLNQQDSFVPTDIGIFLALPTGAQDITFKLIPYSSQFVFTNATAMNAIYNGVMQLNLNNVNYTTKWDLWRHWKTNQTQQTAAFGAGSPVDQFDGNEDGFYPMQPFVILTGTSNITLTVQLPLPPTAADANSRIVILYRGVLAQNSTSVN